MKKDSKQTSRGLVKNANPLYNPEGTYPFALNALLGSREGDAGTVTNEDGNIECLSLPENYTVTGACALSDGSSILFSSTLNGTSYIILQDSCNCTHKILIASDCLNFKSYKQIDAISKIVRGCERIIYFTDNYNYYRSINIDRLEDYVNAGYTVDSANLDPANGWNCNRFNHFPFYKPASIDVVNVYDVGGALKVGAYQFAIRYLDASLNATNWVFISNPITIIKDLSSIPYSNITGDAPSDPIANDVSTKLIELTLASLDVSFKYYQLAVVESTQGLGILTNVYILDKQPINSTTSVYTYGGFNPQLHQLTTIGDINIDKVYLETVEAHTQIDNRLVLANVKTFDEDWAALARATLRTQVRWSLDSFASRNEKDARYSYYDKSFMRDEVYALGIVYVFKNGVKSPVFHIPGREANVNYDGNDLTFIGNQPFNEHYRGDGIVNKWDTHLLQVVPDGYYTDPINQVAASNVQYLPNSEFSCTGVTSFTSVDRTLDITVTAISTLSITFQPQLISGETCRIRVLSKGTYPGDPFDNGEGYYFDSSTGLITVNALSLTETWYFYIDFSYGNGTYGYNTVSAEFDTGFSPTVPWTQTINLKGKRLNYIGCSIERWKVYNTALNEDIFTLKGLMAYHESKSLYPDIKDCNNVGIYDATSVGGVNLTGTPIRHHRMPDLSLYGQSLNTEDVNGTLIPSKLGLLIDINDVVSSIPSSILNNIEGYYLVKAKRDNFNKTVLDKGLFGQDKRLTPLFTTPRRLTHSDIPHTYLPTDVFKYCSPHIEYLKYVDQGSHVKIEKVLKSRNGNLRKVGNWHYGGSNEFKAFFLMNYVDDNRFTTGLSNYYGHTRTILNQGFIPYATVVSQQPLFDAELSCQNGRQDSAFIKLNNMLSCTDLSTLPNSFGECAQDNNDNSGLFELKLQEQGSRILYISIKQYKDVYNNLSAIVYNRTHNNIIPITTVNAAIYGGDITITNYSFIQSFAIRNGSADDDFVAGNVYCFSYVESDINVSLKHATSPDTEFAYKYYSVDDYVDILGKYNKKVHWEDDSSKVLTYGKYGFKYNQDYSKLNVESIYLPLDDTFDYCNECNNRQPFTIYWSEASLEDETADSYKVILANNFKTIPGNTGVITNLFLQNDNLFCHTEQALWQLQTRPQQLQTDENTLYIGTGQFLSIPPRRLVSTDYGYAGSKDKFATINTQQGTFFLDADAGKVFLFGDGLNEISLMGMEQWFNTNLALEFNKQFYILTGYKYNTQHTVDKNAIGFISVFDPLHNRVIFHKRDFKIIESKFEIKEGYPTSPVINRLYWVIEADNYVQFYYFDGFAFVQTSLTNRDYFENIGFTMSYDINDKAWASYHSYMPNYMYNTRDKFYSCINDGKVWEHGKRNYCSFYGKRHDHIIELVLNPNAAQEKVFNSVQIISDTFKYSNTDERFISVPNITYDRFVVSNNYQCSGERKLTVKVPNQYQDITLPSNETLIDRTDNYWRFNRFRDLCINRQLLNEPLFTTDWTYRRSSYDNNGQGYIDRVVNPNAIDLNKNIYNQARFRDKYLTVRLFFKPSEDYKLITEIISVLNNESLR